MFDNLVPVLGDTTAEQYKLVRALRCLYIESEYIGILTPMLTAKITDRRVEELTLSLSNGSNTWSLPLNNGVIGLCGDLISYTYNDAARDSDGNPLWCNCYCELRIDKNLDSSIVLAPSVVRGGFTDGSNTKTTIAVESPIEVGVTGNIFSIKLDYQGLTAKAKESRNCILSINGVVPDELGNINITSYNPNIRISVR